MGGITGFWNLDGRPADRDVLERMMDAVRHRGPDGRFVTVDSGLALGQHLHDVLPEPGAGRPFEDADAGLIVTLHGRIANLRDACADLSAQGYMVRSGLDAECVARAYQAYGPAEFVRPLVGDFAVAIYDRRQARLVLARDPMGLKPLFYAADATRIRWGNQVSEVLADPAVPRCPNDGMIAEYLASAFVTTDETLWRDVRRLPPGCTMVVADGSARTIRNWEPRPDLIRLPRVDEYAERFLWLFRQAVRGCLRAAGPVAGCDLSGGLDSSSVVAIAVEQATAESSRARPEAFSVLYPGVADADESGYIEAVVQHTGVPWYGREPQLRGVAWYEREAQQTLDFPGYPNGAPTASVLVEEMVRRGARVHLGGTGGDECFWDGDPALRLADFARRGEVRQALRELRFLRSSAGPRRTGRKAAAALVLAALPRDVGLRVWTRRHARWRPPPWLGPRFSAESEMAARWARLDPGIPRFEGLEHSLNYHLLRSASSLHAVEIEERQSAVHGVEMRAPFLDRRVFEFGLSLPPELHRDGNTTKSLLRQAMVRHLPERVRMRAGKAHFGHLVAQEIGDAVRSGAIGRAPSPRAGWVESCEVADLAREVWEGYLSGSPTYWSAASQVWRMIGLSLWRRSAPC